MREENEEEEDEELCDYTGDLCIGDKMFCEECEVLQELGDEDAEQERS